MRNSVAPLVIVLILLLAPLTTGVAAQSVPPQPPMSLYGDVTINGHTEVSGYTLIAVNGNGTEIGRTEVTDGSYGGSGPYEAKLDIECNCDDGDTIRFVLSGTQTEQTVAFDSGKVKQQNLTFTGVTPPPSEDSGGDGGSSGGGSSLPTPPQTPTNSSAVATVPIEDSDPTAAGTTVELNESDSVQEVTFNRTVNGTLAISEADIDTNDTDEIQAAFDETDSSDIDVVVAVDISPDSEAVAETSATIEISVPRTEINDPANVFVVHQGDDDWERLETIERRVSNEDLTIVAETESFSSFAAVEYAAGAPQTEADDLSQPSTASVDTVTTDGADRAETTPGSEAGGFGVPQVLGVVAAILGVVIGVMALRRRYL